MTVSFLGLHWFGRLSVCEVSLEGLRSFLPGSRMTLAPVPVSSLMSQCRGLGSCPHRIPDRLNILVISIAGELVFRPCSNPAEGNAQFHLAPEDFARAEQAGEVVAVVHSHPNASPEPSEADRVMCERWGLSWLIVNVPVGHWQVLYPSGYRVPLLGRPFSHGVLDCFSSSATTTRRRWAWSCRISTGPTTGG